MTCVIANTNTRSKKSSSAVTRCSASTSVSTGASCVSSSSTRTSYHAHRTWRATAAGSARLEGMRRLLLLTLAGLVLAGASTALAASRKQAAPRLTVAGSPFGKILFDGRRRARSTAFTSDGRGKSTCYGACASAWPPFLVARKPVAGKGTRKALIGTRRRRDGRLQVTYAGRPLYFFVGDRKPGRCSAKRRRVRRHLARRPRQRPAARPRPGLDVEPRSLEVEVALDPPHHLVADLARVAQLDHGAPLGLEQLAAQALVLERALLDLAVAVRVGCARGSGRSGTGTGRAAARPCRRSTQPRLQLLEAHERRLGGEDPRLRLLGVGAALSDWIPMAPINHGSESPWPTSVASTTANARKTIRPRPGNGSPASVVSGTSSAAAIVTAPRMPFQAMNAE